MCANGVSETGGVGVNRNSFIGCFQKECFSHPDRSPGVFISLCPDGYCRWNLIFDYLWLFLQLEKLYPVFFNDWFWLVYLFLNTFLNVFIMNLNLIEYLFPSLMHC